MKGFEGSGFYEDGFNMHRPRYRKGAWIPSKMYGVVYGPVETKEQRKQTNNIRGYQISQYVKAEQERVESARKVRLEREQQYEADYADFIEDNLRLQKIQEDQDEDFKNRGGTVIHL
jgi:hypothetical protein